MTTPETSRRPLPHISPLGQPFWDATQRNELVIQRCTTCGRYWWLPQMACRRCRTETLEWTRVSGRGEVYSYVVMHHAATPGFTAPYTVAVVTLEEGPRFLTNLVDIDPTHVRVGLPVQVRFTDVDGPLKLPDFAPR